MFLHNAMFLDDYKSQAEDGMMGWEAGENFYPHNTLFRLIGPTSPDIIGNRSVQNPMHLLSQVHNAMHAPDQPAF